MSWAGHVDRMGKGEAYTGFPPDGSGRQICTTIGKGRLYTKNRNNTGTQNIQTRKQKFKTNSKHKKEY
jgi:hypothetical protein